MSSFENFTRKNMYMYVEYFDKSIDNEPNDKELFVIF